MLTGVEFAGSSKTRGREKKLRIFRFEQLTIMHLHVKIQLEWERASA